MTERNQERRDDGVVFITMVVMVVPLVLLVGAFIVAMNGRTSRLMAELDSERALLAAESGVDMAIWLGETGFMTDGLDFQHVVGGGASFQLESTYLRTDGISNDGDALVDAADPDEDVYQIVVTGRFKNATRKIAAYLGPIPLLPTSFDAAMTVQNPNVEIDLNGTPLLTGANTNIDGSPGDPAEDVHGLAVAPPGTVADLLGELDASEQAKVEGLGGAPSLGTGSTLDLQPIIDAVQNSANVVLTNSQYSSFDFGDGAAGTTTIAYRNGDVKFKGNTTGAGVLVVTGDLEMTGNFRYDGVIIVLGDVEAGNGTAHVNGAIIQGPAGEEINCSGTFDLTYSAEAIALANSLGGSYVAFNGWQEIAR